MQREQWESVKYFIQSRDVLFMSCKNSKTQHTEADDALEWDYRALSSVENNLSSFHYTNVSTQAAANSSDE